MRIYRLLKAALKVKMPSKVELVKAFKEAEENYTKYDRIGAKTEALLWRGKWEVLDWIINGTQH